jgi:hypothetical protein
VTPGGVSALKAVLKATKYTVSALAEAATKRITGGLAPVTELGVRTVSAPDATSYM